MYCVINVSFLQGFGLCVLHGRIYAVGGHGTATPIDKVEAYDPRMYVYNSPTLGSFL